MKRNPFSTFLLASTAASALLLAGCNGDDGAMGQQGPQGVAGATGNPGATGPAGADGANGAGQLVALEQIGRTASRGFAVSAAEIVAFDAAGQRIFTVNADSGAVDVFSASDLANPTLLSSLDMAQMLVDQGIAANTGLVGAANSIAVHGSLAAVAVEASPKTDNGWVVLLNLSDLSYAAAVPVGALPDMVTFTPDGSQLLVANEGEPNEGYSIDPEGSVSVIDTGDFSVVHIGFSDFNDGNSRYGELPLERMIIDGYSAVNAGNRASVAQSLEPEYITVSDDGSQAYVALQENNAVAVIDLADNSVARIFGLGFKNHAIPGNEMDAGDEDGGIQLQNWPVMGIYMPDSMASFSYNNKTYLLTANEGDSREDFLAGVADQPGCEAAGYYFRSGECLDEVRVKHLVSRAGLTLGPALAGLDGDDKLGRLKASHHTTVTMNGGSTINTVYAYGARSFSIWDTTSGEQVFDSGNDFERITALRYGLAFNNNNDENANESRSDDKGPEPEAIAVGRIGGHTYAFIGLERMGGIMVYDISNPFAPQYVQYVNNRRLDVAPADGVDAGDLGPEGMQFVSAGDSPNGEPLLIVGNEVSGTTTVYRIQRTLLQD